MARSYKIWMVLLCIFIGALLIGGYLHYCQMKQVIARLDSAMRRIDSAQMRLDSSRQTIMNLQDELLEYQTTAHEIAERAKELDIHSQESQKQFNHRLQNLDEAYAKNKKLNQTNQRTFWPKIIIDTTTHH